MTNGRQQLRRTFESAARLYQRARPEYPAELFAELIWLAGLAPGGRLLEIGCVTGKATVPLARADSRSPAWRSGRSYSSRTGPAEPLGARWRRRHPG